MPEGLIAIIKWTMIIVVCFIALSIARFIPICLIYSNRLRDKVASVLILLYNTMITKAELYLGSEMGAIFGKLVIHDIFIFIVLYCVIFPLIIWSLGKITGDKLIGKDVDDVLENSNDVESSMGQKLPLYNTTELSLRTNRLIKLEFILMGLVCIVSITRYIAALNGIEFGTDENISYSGDSIDIAYGVAASACLLVIIFSNIISMRWRYLAYRNTYRLSSKGYTCTPKWMIWGWIVPFVLLNIPIDIMKQFSRRISKEINQDIISIGLIKFRWILVVIDALLQRGLDLSTDTTQQVIKSGLIEVAILLISMLAIYITLIFYKKITAQEQEWLAFKLNSLKQ